MNACPHLTRALLVSILSYKLYHIPLKYKYCLRRLTTKRPTYLNGVLNIQRLNADTRLISRIAALMSPNKHVANVCLISSCHLYIHQSTKWIERWINTDQATGVNNSLWSSGRTKQWPSLTASNGHTYSSLILLSPILFKASSTPNALVNRHYHTTRLHACRVCWAEEVTLCSSCYVACWSSMLILHGASIMCCWNMYHIFANLHSFRMLLSFFVSSCYDFWYSCWWMHPHFALVIIVPSFFNVGPSMMQSPYCINVTYIISSSMFIIFACCCHPSCLCCYEFWYSCWCMRHGGLREIYLLVSKTSVTWSGNCSQCDNML